MDSVGCDFEVFEADVDAPESGLMLVEPEKAWSLPPLALALFPVLFMFALRLEVEVGVVVYNSISFQIPSATDTRKKKKSTKGGGKRMLVRVIVLIPNSNAYSSTSSTSESTSP